MDRGKLTYPVKRMILQALLVAWVILWVMFVVREVFVKGRIHDYTALFGRTFDGKHAYVTGDDLYAFIDFCRTNTPTDASFRFEGLEDGALEKRRAVYYFYPRLEREDPDFIFVYKVPGLSRAGYEPFVSLDDERYILRKTDGRS